MLFTMMALALQAAAPAPACTTTVAPPAGLEAWSTISAISMGPIAIGQATGAMLRPVDKVVFALAPSRAPKPGSFGGTYQFNVTSAATYRIALAAGAWIDVVREGKIVDSVAHTEGAPCSGIRKIVDFALTPGRYSLQLSGAKDAPMRILIAAK